MLTLALLLLGVTGLDGQIANVKVAATSMQAVISYTAPDTGVCSVDIREGSSTAPLIHDVDPSLFPGSDLDSRSASLGAGRRRVFVAGKRIAESALDGRRYSRALQADTVHALKITCGTNIHSGEFTTTNSPLGATRNDPLPPDPNHPGQYAWPSISWTDRNEWVIDPLTGFRVKKFDSPRDAIENQGSGQFISATNVGTGTGWTNPGAVTGDDNSAAVYSGATQDWMFVELGLAFQNSARHETASSSLNTLVPTFNAWCSGSDCSSASSDDRSIEFCLTVDGFSCASDRLQAALQACSSNCSGSSYRFAAMSNPQPILAEWFRPGSTFPTLDLPSLSKRGGTVNRNGATVTLVFGDHFNLGWPAGSKITINGTVYAIASVDHDAALTLAGSPAGSDASAQYVASNAGLLIHKKTASTHEISVQYVSYSAETGGALISEAVGDEDSLANCAATLVAGPTGEMGWHCQVTSTLYWIGQTSGTVNRIGRAVPAYNPDPDGWNQNACAGGAYWDWMNGNVLYCPIPSLNGHLYVLKLTYTGNNADVGDLLATQGVTTCGSAPCWTIVNLTPSATNMALETQIAAFHPEWVRSHFKTNAISLFGRMAGTNSLLFMARRDAINDTMAFLFQFDLNTRRIVAGIPTWRYWPLRWSAMHGPFNLNDPVWVHVSSTTLRGPYSGGDVAGNGPYYSTIASGPITTSGAACPARPANSPIAVSDWPVGNKCLSVTVDGEPGDPTPGQYSGGTISVSGTTVTGTNTFWTSFMDGSQMRIGGTYYTFTYVSFSQGTLDSSPGTITNSPYTIFLEPVGNPKLGNPNFAYLQDAEVRDTFCLANNGTTTCGNQYYPGGPEIVRLLVKNGNSWILQRGYHGISPPTPFSAVGANAWLTVLTTSCYFSFDYPCAESRVDWNVADIYGLNAAGTTAVKDPNELGCCHATRQNGVNVDSSLVCPTRDGSGSGCYFARYNSLPKSLTDPGFLVSSNPPFHGKVGVGYPNSVDSHASHNQFSANDVEKSWIGDARPLLGDDLGGVFGSPSSPGVKVEGSLYKFTAAQTNRLRPRILPTIAACGPNTLLDISGPSSTISSASSDNYKYCIALAGGECAPGSSAGDVYVNCPQIKAPYCTFQGVGQSDPDTRDICIMDNGAYTMNAAQMGVRTADPNGRYGRRVTAGFSRYHWVNPYWNVKILPDGRWMLVWSAFLDGLRNSILLVRLPPFPSPDGINRGDYIPLTVTVPPPSVAGVNNAVVQFGYDTNYFCNSRQEMCVQGSATDFAYQSENPAGVPCSNGCTINVQTVTQRILYYRIVLRDSSNHVLATLPPEVRAIQ